MFLKSNIAQKPVIYSALIISLFVYLFYRSEQTVVNELFRFLFSSELYLALRSSISGAIELPSFFIFSLPEGLWVLAVTLASKSLYISFKKTKLELAILPIFFAITLELLQLIELTNGTFDWLDLLSAFCFWCLGYFFIVSPSKKQKLFQTVDFSSILCVSTYLIVFLAHVSN